MTGGVSSRRSMVSFSYDLANLVHSAMLISLRNEGTGSADDTMREKLEDAETAQLKTVAKVEATIVRIGVGLGSNKRFKRKVAPTAGSGGQDSHFLHVKEWHQSARSVSKRRSINSLSQSRNN